VARGEEGENRGGRGKRGRRRGGGRGEGGEGPGERWGWRERRKWRREVGGREKG